MAYNARYSKSPTEFRVCRSRRGSDDASASSSARSPVFGTWHPIISSVAFSTFRNDQLRLYCRCAFVVF